MILHDDLMLNVKTSFLACCFLLYKHVSKTEDTTVTGKFISLVENDSSEIFQGLPPDQLFHDRPIAIALFEWVEVTNKGSSYKVFTQESCTTENCKHTNAALMQDSNFKSLTFNFSSLVRSYYIL